MSVITTTLPTLPDITDKTPLVENNSILYAHTETKYNYPEHKTPYLFITNSLNKGQYYLNNSSIEISDRSFYFINNEDRLGIRFREHLPRKTLLILFNKKFIENTIWYFNRSDEQLINIPESGSQRLEIPRVPYSFDSIIKAKLNHLLNNSRTQDDVDEILLEFLAEFYRHLSQIDNRINRIGAVKRTTQEELYRRLHVAQEFMEDHVFENPTVDEIANVCTLNKFHFMQRFKELYGSTPHQYFTEIKLKKANELLRDNKMNVSEVCYALNYGSLGSFSNLFKRRFKTSPSSITQPN